LEKEGKSVYAGSVIDSKSIFMKNTTSMSRHYIGGIEGYI
jgi:hypothetical protein